MPWKTMLYLGRRNSVLRDYIVPQKVNMCSGDYVVPRKVNMFWGLCCMWEYSCASEGEFVSRELMLCLKSVLRDYIVSQKTNLCLRAYFQFYGYFPLHFHFDGLISRDFRHMILRYLAIAFWFNIPKSRDCRHKF